MGALWQSPGRLTEALMGALWQSPGRLTEALMVALWQSPGRLTDVLWRIPGRFTEALWLSPGRFTEEKKCTRSLQGAKRLRRSFSLLRSQIRICPQMLERARHLRPLSSLLLTYFSAMTSCSQTCMIKARIASRSGAPAMLHPFGIRSFCTRPAHKMASSSCVGARKMSANARASSAFAAAFLAALIILQFHGQLPANMYE